MQALKDISPSAQNNITTRFIILEKGRKTETGISGTAACLALVADETAAVHFQLWGDECHAFEPGDIVRLTDGIFSYGRNGGFVLRAGKRGRIEKVGEFTMTYVETPNLSEIRWKPETGNPTRYVQDGVVSTYSRIFPRTH